MPRSGCPVSTEFSWSEGLLRQDTEDSRPSNNWSSSLHLNGEKRDSTISQHFCVKTNNTGKPQWPAGKYCIYKKGKCPYGKDPAKRFLQFQHESIVSPFSLMCPRAQKVSKSGFWQRWFLPLFVTLFRSKFRRQRTVSILTKWANLPQPIPTYCIVIAHVMLKGKLAA